MFIWSNVAQSKSKSKLAGGTREGWILRNRNQYQHNKPQKRNEDVMQSTEYSNETDTKSQRESIAENPNEPKRIKLPFIADYNVAPMGLFEQPE